MKYKPSATANPGHAHGAEVESDRHLQVGPPGETIELTVVPKDRRSSALSEKEQAGLAECEGIIERGFSTFYEVGSALWRIREERFYRSSYSNFAEYCRERWSIGRAYAYRVLGAAERLKLLSGDEPLPKPENEFQMRPFLKLKPEDFPGAWKQAVKTASGGKITARIVQAVIRELQPEDPAMKKKKARKGKVPVGQHLALLHEAKRHIEKGESEKALMALERIENLLVSA